MKKLVIFLFASFLSAPAFSGECSRNATIKTTWTCTGRSTLSYPEPTLISANCVFSQILIDGKSGKKKYLSYRRITGDAAKRKFLSLPEGRDVTPSRIAGGIIEVRRQSRTERDRCIGIN